MKLEKVSYASLKPRQQEIFNFQKIAGLLADYGFNCIKLTDDWQGADFLAYHKDGIETLRVQLKSRLTIDKKYVGKGLYIAFPLDSQWYLIDHETLIQHISNHTNWLNTSAWLDKGTYHSAAPNTGLRNTLSQYRL